MKKELGFSYYLEFTYKLYSQIENTNVITLICLLIGL